MRVLVVGDVMLDIYRIATATRISPEAPVPILLNPRTEYRLGGAGAVAAMCRALGADVTLIGVIGCDRNGETVRELVDSLGITCKLSNSPAPRPTTAKERICAVASGQHRQQLGRLDTEQTSAISPGEAAAMAGLIIAEAADVVILVDRLDRVADAVSIARRARGVRVASRCRASSRAWRCPVSR